MRAKLGNCLFLHQRNSLYHKVIFRISCIAETYFLSQVKTFNHKAMFCIHYLEWLFSILSKSVNIWELQWLSNLLYFIVNFMAICLKKTNFPQSSNSGVYLTNIMRDKIRTIQCFEWQDIILCLSMIGEVEGWLKK